MDADVSPSMTADSAMVDLFTGFRASSSLRSPLNGTTALFSLRNGHASIAE
jgi:hypothetical protein